MTSASRNRRSKNVIVEAVVIFELTFRDVEREIFGADFVIAANNRPLEDAPEAFNRVRVNRADNVLASAVHDGLVRVFVVQAEVAAMLVSGEQADLFRNRFPNEFLHVLFADELQNAGDYVALALHSANDRNLGARSMFAALAALADVFIVVFPANPRFIDFNDAAKLVHVLFDQGGADFVAHAPSGFDRTEAHKAPQLTRADALFGGEHQVRNFIPIPEGLVGVFKDGPGQMGEPVGRFRGAFVALPMMTGSQRLDLRSAAAGAMDPIRPAPGNQIGNAIVLSDEHCLELSAGKLMNGFGFLAGHGVSPSNYGRNIAWQI